MLSHPLNCHIISLSLATRNVPCPPPGLVKCFSNLPHGAPPSPLFLALGIPRIAYQVSQWPNGYSSCELFLWPSRPGVKPSLGHLRYSKSRQQKRENARNNNRNGKVSLKTISQKLHPKSYFLVFLSSKYICITNNTKQSRLNFIYLGKLGTCIGRQLN